jgi:hypothetical protein
MEHLNYGYGSGDGSGYGSGDGYGSGYGYGYGSGAGDGYGYGYGYGYSYGYGYGYGSGYSSGSGYGYGSGDGYGYGSGVGYGYGSGDGDGYGSGDGSGDGYGYGSSYGSSASYGYGSKEYWQSTIKYFAAKWAPAQRERLRAVLESGAIVAFWRSNENGLPSNGGGNIEPAAPGVIHTAPGPINLCKAGTLHATLLPPKWHGARIWIVALIGDVIGDGEKYGALHREIIGEAL